LRGTFAFTNKTPVGTYRALGCSRNFFSERLDIAVDLGIDPAEIRRRNLIPHRHAVSREN
jgi:CO/xanthine dehydrogenase Mo-binding subunit